MLKKCKIYFGNVETQNKLLISQITDFQEGTLPFKYLGITLSSKKLTVAQCLLLVEKIVCRIRHWSTRLLSFVGRIQLVKSVLFVMAIFWIQSVPQPKKIIKAVEAIYRSFI